MADQDRDQLQERRRLHEIAGSSAHIAQISMGLLICAFALLLGWGTWQITASTIPQQDGGARLVPGLVAGALLLCGVWLIWDACHGGWHAMPSVRQRMRILPWAWVSAGYLISALLLVHAGFVVAAVLCYVFTVNGLRLAAQQPVQRKVWTLLMDTVVGLCLASAVYVLYVHGFSVDLPQGVQPWK